jgi:lipoprotein-anchoring transpeptidase ErfK/SrfK
MAAAAAAMTAGFGTSAGAFSFNWQPQAAPPAQVTRPAVTRPVRPAVARPARPSGAAAGDKEKKGPSDSPDELATKAKGILGVVISLDRQQLTLYSDGRPIAQSRVSTGTAGHPTPTGVFSVIQKDRWHRSNLYNNAPMFYMQRITWSGVAMHQGIVPNQPASHGCIRLPEAFARQLWRVSKLGTRVVIARGQVAPVEIAHKRLFTLPREPTEPAPEVAASSADRVKGAYGVLEVGRSGAPQVETATDAAKPKDPTLDAMALALTKPREPAATSSEMVKSTYDAFEMRRSKPAVGTGTGAGAVAEVTPYRHGPISVFISRREGKLFVRKGFEPMFDVAVTFVRPEQPLGTHVFTALSLKDDETTLRWNVITLPTSPRKPEKGKQPEWSGPPSTAGQALDRVTIPPEALERITELMSVGASLIISDQGLGPETGRGTDFIVLTR